jgi:hypothetical protein
LLVKWSFLIVNKSITLLPGENYIEGNGEEGITKVMHIPPLHGEGLYPGEYDFIIDSIISEGSTIHGGKDIPIRISLNRKTTWEEILKAIPKGSLVKSYIKVR